MPTAIRVLTPSESEELAALLLKCGAELLPDPRYIRDEPAEKYLDRFQMYMFSLVLMAILVQESNDRNWVPVRESFESVLFHSKPAQEIAAAIADLSDLFSALRSKSRAELRWARLWMLGADIVETNPELLRQFVVSITHRFYSACTMLDKMASDVYQN